MTFKGVLFLLGLEVYIFASSAIILLFFFSSMPKIIVSPIVFFKLLAVHSKSDFSFLPLIHVLVTVCLG